MTCKPCHKTKPTNQPTKKKKKQHQQKKIPLKMINQYDWKYLGAELRITCSSTVPWKKENS